MACAMVQWFLDCIYTLWVGERFMGKGVYVVFPTRDQIISTTCRIMCL